jgi:hypothetical protein
MHTHRTARTEANSFAFFSFLLTDVPLLFLLASDILVAFLDVGNTTILASRMVPSDLMSDPAYLYMEGVKIHEYYRQFAQRSCIADAPPSCFLSGCSVY